MVAAGALGLGTFAWATGAQAPRPAAGTAVPAAAPTPSPTTTVSPFPREPLTPATRYVALGDSYAAGMGAGGETGKCRVSDTSYPDLFAEQSHVDLIVNAACSGATTSDLLNSQLIALDDRTDLVTVSVGGNDLGVADVAGSCAAGKAVACRDQLSSALSLLNILPQRLDAVYKAIAQAAPNARIVVTGYAALYDVSNSSAPDFGMATAIDAATIGLNEVIKEAVEKARESGIPMTFVAVDFDGHGIGSAHPWIHGTGADAFHPTAAGYREYSRALVRLLGTAG